MWLKITFDPFQPGTAYHTYPDAKGRIKKRGKGFPGAWIVFDRDVYAPFHSGTKEALFAAPTSEECFAYIEAQREGV